MARHSLLDAWSDSGQVGTPHPQAPTNTDARMFKVLREVVETTSQGSKADMAMSVGGRVRSPAMKALLAKQLGVAMNSFEGEQGLLDLKTGAIKGKKAKKEKTPEQAALVDAKALLTKLLDP